MELIVSLTDMDRFQLKPVVGPKALGPRALKNLVRFLGPSVSRMFHKIIVCLHVSVALYLATPSAKLIMYKNC